MKNYEKKLLNQLLQEQELIIKRNGYCFKFWYNKNKRHLYTKRDDESTCYNIYETTAEELVDIIKKCINHTYDIGLHYYNNSFYLQKNGTWTDNEEKADKYCKKPNLDYIVGKAKQKAIDFIKKNQLKIDKKRCFNLLIDRNCINIMKIL